MYLLREAGIYDPLPLAAEAAQNLTRYAVVTSYPGDLGDVDEDEWQRAVAEERAVVEWAGRIVTSSAI